MNQSTRDVHSSRLYLLGKHELFGMEEIIDNSDFRKTTVICTSTDASLYFIMKEHFIDCVNLYKFSEKVLQEQALKHQLYIKRIQ